MTERELYDFLTTAALGDILVRYPLARDFLSNIRVREIPPEMRLEALLAALDDTVADEFGLRKEDIPYQLCRFLLSVTPGQAREASVSSLTILGGRNKSGEAENVTLTLARGEVAAVVGPTGSGKSRLLADIECLAQRDTPTGRQVLVNGQEVPDETRFDMDGKLVAQLSQNMNFVMDMSVREFLEMHARSRFSEDVDKTVALCMACANNLAGEQFSCDTKVTQLSGGQSRALMIADTAYMSVSPLVLIDEIENAGIDRKKAIRVLTKNDKIVLIATHDPLLALNAGKRIVIKNGGIFKVIETTPEEKRVLADIEKIDDTLLKLRTQLRSGARITALDAL
ncbi:ABC-type lipoprotein export system, ATPase component [Sporobacter termitidis DSM 10068]|uniref:ABC-type lipoprotein export system, ATPase component n=1 Tax=Sporobacter termitidis DSM 10068 TaxID=1123282 RepID=A0A1M5Z549_9FIRM|nr:ATP-binding cassette domain-containing protein [Sporobacter termitidis]SHI19264.1 ABC-type lipoprotein export system, ATPase component [Sporobacter termitidis DSM 10068]